MSIQIKLAYLAGLVDGEGYIGIKKTKAYKCQGRVTPGYHARIQVRMVDEAAIKFLAETLGGSYYKERRNKEHRKPLFCFSASDQKAIHILTSLIPFLRVKHAVASVVLQFAELQKDGGRYKTKVVGHRSLRHWCGTIVTVPNLAFTDEYVSRCEELYQQCKRMNKTGV